MERLLLLLISVILSTPVARASCPSFAEIDQVYQVFGYNEESRLAVKCLTELKISEKDAARYYRIVHGLWPVMQERINRIALREDEITEECNRACAFDRKVAEGRRRLLVDNFANTQLRSPLNSEFARCFGDAVSNAIPRAKVAR